MANEDRGSGTAESETAADRKGPRGRGSGSLKRSVWLCAVAAMRGWPIGQAKNPGPLGGFDDLEGGDLDEEMGIDEGWGQDLGLAEYPCSVEVQGMYHGYGCSADIRGRAVAEPGGRC